jgi:pSer/pThr/pTyr-binding forkhead associated (FHA) protein
MKSKPPGKVGEVFLLIEKGGSYPAQTRFRLDKRQTVIGRRSSTESPDIAFDSPFVSRRHLVIESRDGKYFAIDEGSTNGSSINALVLDKNVAIEIHDCDRIKLANDAVVLQFVTEKDSDTLPAEKESSAPDIILDDSRKEIIVRGKSMRLSGNLYRLFQVLYGNRGRAVSNSEIRVAVWPERARDEGGIPNAADVEINTLVMRLRKKLGVHSSQICNLRGYGYMMDIR